MDLNRLMRSLLPIAVVVAATGCSSPDDSSSSADASDTAQASETPTVSPLEGVTEPLELEIQAPAGFTADDELQRDVPMSEAGNTYGFRLDGGQDTALLMVSSYVLESAVDDSDYLATTEFIREYDATLGHEYTAENDRGTLAHGRSGVGMLVGFEESGTKVIQQNHFFFEGKHAVHVTCQWTDPDFTAVYDGCMELLQNFPFPDGWDS